VTGLKSIADARRRFFANLYPRERWTPAEWSERCRVLSPEESSEPGPYRFDRTPYWRAVIDAAARPGVKEVVCLKGAQVGWSEVCRNVLGYWIDLDPGPAMVLMPDQKSAEDFREERIEPLMRHTPAVGRHVSSRAWDTTKHRIKFDTMSVFFVWAGSRTGTKSRPIRYLVCEEPDEYPPYSSAGGDPLSKAEKRLTTYRDKGRSRALLGGTPTTRRGNIWKRWEACAVRYHYWVPCPHCQGYQRLEWKQVKWPDFPGVERAAKAERVEREGLAHYECGLCQRPVRDHDKPRMLRRGVWATEDQAVTADGRVVGPAPAGLRVGYHLPSLYSPWVTFGQLAREWVEAQGDQQALSDFINQRLAEPFEEQRAKTEPDFIAVKAKGGGPPMVVPAWARLLIATADTQGNNEADGYFWYVVRAWGYGYRSQLVDYGVCSSKAELRDRCLNRPIPVEGNGGGAVTPQVLLVDSGGPRWNEVYQFSQQDPRIHPTKGENQGRDFMVVERPQKNHGVVLWKIDTEQSKDLLHLLIHDPDRTKWLPHNQVNDDYCAQMCSESKVFDPQLNRETWVEVVKNNNHLWDCEHQQAAAAWRMGAWMPEPPAEARRPPQPAADVNEAPAAGGSWVNGYRGRY
jgi:phage terminase large subunit GpA-like protein